MNHNYLHTVPHPRHPMANVSTITVWPGLDAEIINKAISYFHGNGVRAVMPVLDLDTNQLSNQTYRSFMIDHWAAVIEKHCYDGLGFDVEQAMFKNSTRNLYTTLVSETYSKLKQLDKRIFLSMAVPYTAEPLGCISGRCKHWKAMAEYLEVLFVMGYDSQTDIITASATASLQTIEAGLESYINLNIPRKKLILAVPWFSYVYPCVYVNKQSDIVPPCLVNFFGRFEENLTDTLSFCASSIDGINYDDKSHTVYCTTRSNSGRFEQRWFDTPETLTEKYTMALQHKIGGFGLWHLDSVGYPLEQNPISKQYWHDIAQAAQQAACNK